MKVGKKFGPLQPVLLLYGFLLFGHVTSIKCNKFLMSTSVQNTEVTECTTQGPEYCFTFVLRDDNGAIIHEELGCVPETLPLHVTLDLVDYYCTGPAVNCCTVDYCNKKLAPLPTPLPTPLSPDTPTITPVSGYLTASIAVASVTAVLLAVMSLVCVVYFYWWKRRYSRLIATAGVNNARASYASSGSSTGTVFTPTFHI